MTKFTNLIFKKDFSPHAPKADFNLEELETHQKQAYQEGYEAGKKESEAELRSILSCVSKDIQSVLQAKEKSLFYTISIAEKICETLFPRYSQEGALAEVRAMIEHLFEKINGESVYTIRCTPRIQGELEEYFKTFDPHFEFNIQGDENFSGSDLHISWKNGFVWRSEVELLDHIKDILASFKEIHHG